MKKTHKKTENSLNIIIVGCGKVGQNLAVELVGNGNNVTVIDDARQKVKECTERCDCMGVVGNGATHAVQLSAGIKSADLFIAVTGSDELNILCCLIARHKSNCKTIARVRNPEYSKDTKYLKEELGLAMVINPQQAAAEEINRVLRFPSAMKIDSFALGKVELVRFRLPEQSPLVGMSVRDVVAQLKCDVLICTIEREDEAYIAKANFRFEEKDIISIVASPKNAANFFSKIGHKSHSVKDVIIAGGGRIAVYLCKLLIEDGISVKIIEKDEQICDELSSMFPEAIIVHGNAGDQDTLISEGIERAGAFIALTSLDEENILLSLFAKSVSQGKLITKINRSDFSDVVKHLDLDTTIYPKDITSDLIVRYVRAMKNTIGSNVETLRNIVPDRIEATEFIVKENSPITKGTLAELQFKKGVLVAAILRKSKVIIPRGSDSIIAGDRVVIVSKMMDLHDISDVLE